MLPTSLYRYIWRVSRTGQIHICILTAIIAPLSMAPLELQRRIVNEALKGGSIKLLALYGGAYLAVVLIQNGAKYLLNITKGRVLEDVARDVRRKVFLWLDIPRAADEWGRPLAVDHGTTVSVLAAESENLGGFASESFSVPLLQAGTIASVIGYLLWVEPLIAAFTFVIYLPQALTVPKVQNVINRLARRRTRTIRRLGHVAADADDAPPAKRRAHAERLIDHAYKTRISIYWRKYFLTFLGNVLDAIGPIAVLMVGGWMVIHGQTQVSTLVVFISGFQKIADPWDVLINFYRTVSIARVSYRLVAEVLEDKAAPPPIPARAA
jgi:ABC-type multidrug transport system fused ATPase/permease subunit